MKRTIKTLGVFLSAFFLLTGCSSDDHEGTTDASLFQVRNFANSGCKKVGEATTRGGYFADYPEYVEYKSMKDGVLSLSHVNAPVSALPIRTTLAASTISESLIEKIRQFQRKAPSSNRVAHFFVPQATYPLFNLHYANCIM